MIPSKAPSCAIVALSISCLSLAGCGRSPNFTVIGTVESATYNYKTGRSLLTLLDRPYYNLKVNSDQGEVWFAWVDSAAVSREDIEGVISKRVTFTCYKDPNEKSPAGCHAQSLRVDGRELIR